MILKTLTIKDFLSHENTTISFKENEKILLDGKSGSGKSSITEAILWGLFGKGRTENRSLIRRGEKSAAVSIKFADGHAETLITRTVSDTGKNVLSITQNTGSKGQFIAIQRTGLKDLQEWIEQVFLRASYELFTNSVAYPQENENSFVKTTASRRKDLLLEIVGAENFDKLYDQTRNILNTNKLESSNAVTKIEVLETIIKDAKGIEKEHDIYKKQNETISVEIEKQKLKEKDLDKQVNNISNLLGQISDKKSLKIAKVLSAEEINNQLKTDQETVKNHESIDIKTATTNVEEATNLQGKTTKIEKEIRENAIAQEKINAHLANKPAVNDYTEEIVSTKKRLVPLVKDSGSCPAGDDCPFVAPIKGQIEFLKDQIAQKTERMKSEKIALELWEQDYVLLVPVKDTKDLYTQLEGLKDKIIVLLESEKIVTAYNLFEETLIEIKKRELELDLKKKRLMAEIVLVENQIQKLEKESVKSDINQINIDLAKIRLSLHDLQDQKDKAISDLALAVQAKETILKSTAEIKDLRKIKLKLKTDGESLELLKEALSPRGVKAVIVDYLVPQLEERINDILGQMSDFRIRLDTQKATVDEESLKEGLFITVINDRKEELPFASYSGGEKVKITIAISEALASLMNQIGFRLMDENIVSLDSESTEGFVTVLTALQEKFPQLIVVSHLQEVKDMFEKQIMISKVNGVSKII
ncbi:MAG TPA: SMC family ATPase [Candidatus Pacearchaeota archaeon]|nr:SMC family ATPase [Candidatus Pacearchaeota archaeon]